MQEELKRFITENQLDGNTADLLSRRAEPVVRYAATGIEDYAQIGSSRLAGCPDLPPTIEWPLDPDGEYWTFIAQINLAELPVLPYEGMPRQGILYFFLGLDEPAYDIEHRIYYYDGDPSLLKKTVPPEGLEEISGEYRGFVPHKLKFEAGWTLPDDVRDLLMDEYPDAYDALDNDGAAIWGQHQGWAGDTPLEAYLCRSGLQDILFHDHKTVEELQREAREAEERGSTEHAERLLTHAVPQLEAFSLNREQHLREASNWHVLLSIPSFDEAGMCWWDAGYVEFLIDRRDLAQLNFSRTYANLATS